MKYKVTSPWREHERQVIGPPGTDENHSVLVVWEMADIHSEDGWDYTDGTHRVKAHWALSGKSYRRARRFNGELAWSNAQRLYNDLYYEITGPQALAASRRGEFVT